MSEKVFLLLLFATVVTAAMELSELNEASILTLDNRQERIIERLLAEIEQIKTRQKNDREDIDSYHREVLELKKENEELKAIIASNSAERGVPDRGLATAVERLDLKNKSETLRKVFSKRGGFTTAPTPTKSPRKAAFSAKLSRYDHQIATPATIVFDVIITNVGDHYSDKTGYFTAPEDGTYFFLATTFSRNSRYIETYLKRNGEFLVSMRVDDKVGFETGAAGVVLVLNRGDYVYVAHNYGENDECIYGEFSNFSGFQI